MKTKPLFQTIGNIGKRELAKRQKVSVRSSLSIVDDITRLYPDQYLNLKYPIMSKGLVDAVGGAKAARHMLKYEEPILVSRPSSVDELRNEKTSPAQYITQSLDEQLRSKSQNQIFSTGYALTPVRGSNRSTSIISLDNILLGVMLFNQDMQGENAKVSSYISDNEHIHTHGAIFNVNVGRMTTSENDNRNSHHHYKWVHVPVTDNDEKYLIGWDARASTEGAEPTYGQFFFRYPSGRRRASDRDATFLDEHAIAGYLNIIHSHWKESTVPLEMSPIIIPSRCTAEFYKRLRKQVVVEDTTKKKGFRGLYKFERAALLSRFTGLYGTQNTWTWNPNQDGKVREYFTDLMHQDQA